MLLSTPEDVPFGALNVDFVKYKNIVEEDCFENLNGFLAQRKKLLNSKRT